MAYSAALQPADLEDPNLLKFPDSPYPSNLGCEIYPPKFGGWTVTKKKVFKLLQCF